MRIRLLLFAHYRDLAGAGEIDLEVPPGATAADVVRVLRSSGGGRDRLPAEPVVAVNTEYVPLDTTIRDGDELALLPPVAGG
ncbi:MAG: MoaD/ThiS family protein [Longimicrobiales bacterium]